MKRKSSAFFYAVLCFLFLFIVGNLFLIRINSRSENLRNIVINRFSFEMEKESNQYENSGLEKTVSEILERNRPEWEREFGKSNVPVKAEFIGENFYFVFSDGRKNFYLILLNGILFAAFLILFIIWFYIYRKIIKPFNELSEYPERLSKGHITEKLPETRNRTFGKFIWGVNMLSDHLESEKKKNRKLTEERQKLITSIAHGIKTPLFNISLYAEALETGLYKNGRPDSQDKDIAEKIQKNTKEITDLVTGMLKASENEIVPYEPEFQTFYLYELSDYVQKEYENRLKVLHIPFKIEQDENFLVNSDKKGLETILTQLMENAIKYGNGLGIKLCLNHSDEIVEMVIKNKGTILNEEELPFIFNSYWRGSNSKNIEGSGIGLSVSRQIAVKLGGDLIAKSHPSSGEMEFTAFVPY